MTAVDRTDRRRVARKLIAGNWDGTGSVSTELGGHESLAQHMIYIAYDTVPTGGTLQVEGRPSEGTKYVKVNAALGALAATGGSIALPFIGYFDAIRLSFPVALAGGGLLSVWVHSSGDDLLAGNAT